MSSNLPPMPFGTSEDLQDREPMDIHTFFSLSYASYLVLPRSVLQSMPIEWQHHFTSLLKDLLEACDAAGINPEPRLGYRVQVVVADTSKYPECSECSPSHACEDDVQLAPARYDPYADYQRGRRNVFREAAR